MRRATSTEGTAPGRRRVLRAGAGLGVAASRLGAAGLARRASAPAAAALGALGATSAGAQDDAPPADAFDFGGGTLHVLSDGHLSLPIDMIVAGLEPSAERDAFVAGNAPDGLLRSPCHLTCWRRADSVVLFDAGAGANFMASAGRLDEALDAAGLTAEEITDVVFTHAHPDHLWGILDDFDDVRFPEARLHMPAAEWDYWRAPGTLDSIGEARQAFVVGARNRFDAIEERVALFAPGDEVAPDVEAIGTEGHTPGHCSFMLHDGGDGLVVTGDAITHPALSFAHPRWPSGSDQDPERGIATRVALLERLAAEKSPIVGFHLPFPAHGRVEAAGSGFRLVPT